MSVISTLKKPGEKIRYTNDMVQELLRCRKDYIYCIRQYVKVRHPVRGIVPFDLFDYQEDMVNTYIDNDRVIVLASRQMGKTETAAAYILLEAIFNNDYTVLIVSHQQSGAIEILDRIKFMYENMPSWLVPGIKVWNRTSIEFENGSKIVARATTKNAGRGLSISLLYCDEFAIIPRNIVEEFWEAVYPVVSTGGRCIITSTPKGDNNRFYYIWRDAYILKKSNASFVPIFIHWSLHPDRDDQWAQKTRADLGDDSKWQQEYECSFLSNADTLVPLTLIDDMIKEVNEPLDANPTQLRNPSWTVWYRVSKKKDDEYFIFVDVSEGVSGDYHVINIFDQYMRQVALYHNNEASIEELSLEIFKASEYYNEARIYLEINGPGMAVIPYLSKVHEIPERLVKENPRKRDPGLRMTAQRRRLGVSNLRQFLESGRLEINSIEALNEIRTFKRRRNSAKYEAEFGCHDDIVMTLVMMCAMIEKIATVNEDVWSVVYGEGRDNLEIEEEQETLPPVPPVSSISTPQTEDYDWLLG